MMDEGIEKLLARLGEPLSCMSVRVDELGQGVDIHLDTSRGSYGEWIPGEGGDICLYRDNETKKVVGAYFPLLNKRLSVWTEGPLKINEGFLRADDLKTIPLRTLRDEIASRITAEDLAFTINCTQHGFGQGAVGKAIVAAPMSETNEAKE